MFVSICKVVTSPVMAELSIVQGQAFIIEIARILSTIDTVIKNEYSAPNKPIDLFWQVIFRDTKVSVTISIRRNCQAKKSSVRKLLQSDKYSILN